MMLAILLILYCLREATVGTKKIIEDYVDEVSKSLAFIAFLERCVCLDAAQKIEFFEQSQKTYG